MTEKFDANALVEDARAGRGCSILNVMQGLSLEDQIKAMRDLKQQAPDVSVTFFGAPRNSFDLKVFEDRGLMTLPKFFERVTPGENTIHFFCRQSDASGTSTSKSFDRPIVK